MENKRSVGKKRVLTEDEKFEKELAERQRKTKENNALMYLAALKEMYPNAEWSNWKDLAGVYQNLTGEVIQRGNLSRKSKNIDFNYLSSEVFRFFAATDKILKPFQRQEECSVKEEKSALEQAKGTDILVGELRIPAEKWGLFDVDINTASVDEIIYEVDMKFSDPRFIEEYYNIDTLNYYVSPIKKGLWTTPVKLQDEHGKYYLEVQNNKQFSFEIRARKEPIPQWYNFEYLKENMYEIFDEYLKEIKTSRIDFLNPHAKPLPKDVIKEQDLGLNEDLAVVLPAVELHFNRQSTVLDHENFYLENAVWRMAKISEDVINYQNKYQASTLVAAVGGDFWNSEMDGLTSSDSNHQSNDRDPREGNIIGTYIKMNFIESLLPHFNETVITLSAGNHDREQSLMTFLLFYERFKDNPKIKIEITPDDLKYTTYETFGDNLLVFNHGKAPIGKDLKSAKDYSDLIENTVPFEIRKNTNKTYVIRGHDHQLRHETLEYKNKPFTVLDFPASTNADQWSAENRYYGEPAFNKTIFHKKFGYVGSEMTLFDEESRQQESKAVRLQRGEGVDKTIAHAFVDTTDQVKEYDAKKENNRLQRNFRKEEVEHIATVQEIINELGFDVDYENLDEEKKQSIKVILGFDKQEEYIQTLKEENKTYVLKPIKQN